MHLIVNCDCHVELTLVAFRSHNTSVCVDDKLVEKIVCFVSFHFLTLGAAAIKCPMVVQKCKRMRCDGQTFAHFRF